MTFLLEMLIGHFDGFSLTNSFSVCYQGTQSFTLTVRPTLKLPAFERSVRVDE